MRKRARASTVRGTALPIATRAGTLPTSWRASGHPPTSGSDRFHRGRFHLSAPASHLKISFRTDDGCAVFPNGEHPGAGHYGTVCHGWTREEA